MKIELEGQVTGVKAEIENPQHSEITMPDARYPTLGKVVAFALDGDWGLGSKVRVTVETIAP